jgi:hypothetical protein
MLKEEQMISTSWGLKTKQKQCGNKEVGKSLKYDKIELNSRT